MVVHVLSIDIGFRNMAFCLVAIDEGKMVVREWGVLPVTKDKSPSLNTIFLQGSLLFRQLLNTHTEKYGKLVVVCEKQLSLARTNSVLMHILFGMCLVLDLDIFTLGSNQKFENRALHDSIDEYDAMEEKCKKKSGAMNIKKLSIAITHHIISTTKTRDTLNIDIPGSLEAQFKASKKKDDLADAFLQAYYYKCKNTQ